MNVCARFDQLFDDLRAVTVCRRQMKGGVAAFAFGIDIRSCLNECPYHLTFIIA